MLRVVHRCTAWLFSFGFCCSKVAMALLGPVLVTIAVLLILFVVFVYFAYTYPALMSPQHHNLSPAMANLVTAFGLYLLLTPLPLPVDDADAARLAASHLALDAGDAGRAGQRP